VTVRAALFSALALMALLTVGCGSQAAAGKLPVRAAASSDPLAGRAFYVGSSPAALDVQRLRAQGRAADANAMERIAEQPTATWLTGRPGDEARVRALTAQATRAGKSALLVAYGIPGRDCGGYSAGGATSAAAYRRWIDGLAQGIGHQTATVIVEPDAVPQLLTAGCVAPSKRAERLSLLRYALRELRTLPNVTTYLDAGNPSWINPPSKLVPSLEAAGISLANGFALNVANFNTDRSVIAYGRELSSELGGKHFVIDTSRNGNGPPASSSRGPAWCNPPGMALGDNPTTDTGVADVDAYLWIKQPGASDGACRPGDPPAGVWMAQYALSLALSAERHG
jgi:endoglucanase